MIFLLADDYFERFHVKHFRILSAECVHRWLMAFRLDHSHGTGVGRVFGYCSHFSSVRLQSNMQTGARTGAVGLGYFGGTSGFWWDLGTKVGLWWDLVTLVGLDSTPI